MKNGKELMDLINDINKACEILTSQLIKAVNKATIDIQNAAKIIGEATISKKKK
jgi:hypothetical protein